MFRTGALAPDGPLLAPGQHPSCPCQFMGCPPHEHSMLPSCLVSCMVHPCRLCSHRPGSQLGIGDAWGFLGQQSPWRALPWLLSWGEPHETRERCRRHYIAKWRLWVSGGWPLRPPSGGWDLPGISVPTALRPHPPDLACPAGEPGRRRHGHPWTQAGGHRTGTARGQQRGPRTQGGSDLFAPGFSGTHSARGSAHTPGTEGGVPACPDPHL